MRQDVDDVTETGVFADYGVGHRALENRARH